MFQNLSKSQKIILALYRLSKGTKIKMRYEDIVVKLFKDYPNEFNLKGYKEYPDSGDLVHKPLYDAKKRGLVNAGNKIFSLTDRGLEVARRIKSATDGKEIRSDNRLSRYAEKEVNRILNLEGFKNIFLGENKGKILDTDFYTYVGVTVRTNRNDFAGRIETMKNMLKELKSLKADRKKPLYEKIIEYHEFLFNKFKKEIDYKLSK